MKRIGLFCACAMLMFAACDSPTATRSSFAFDPTTLTNGVLYRWPTASTVSIWVEPSASVGSDLSTAVDHAIARWNAVPYFGEFKLVRASTIGTANIVVYDRTVPNPLMPASCFFDPRGSGTTYFCFDGGVATTMRTAGGQQTAATVLISMDRGAVIGPVAYQAAVAHEIGHALGIGGHSQDNADVMFGNPENGFPTNRDRQTLRYVLGQRASALLR